METPIKLTLTEPDMRAPAEQNRVEQLDGGFIQVTTTPTWTPKTFRDAVALDTSINRIYYYDFTNSVWKSSGGGFGGYVDASASSPALPTGWTASYNSGTKIFTVTHNLGSASYGLVCVPMGTNALTYYIVLQQARNADNFQVQFSTTGGTAGGTEFNFALIPIT